VSVIEARATTALAVVFGVVGVVAAVLGISWLGIVAAVLLSALLVRTAKLMLDHEAPGVSPRVSPRVPASSDPDVVMGALLEAARAAGEPVAASLWLEDPPTATLRLLTSAGPMGPSAVPVKLDDLTLGRAATEGVATLEPMASLKDADGDTTLWRFAVPISAAAVRGVAAVDLRSVDSPDAGILTEMTAPMRGALAGALALYLARAETETARALLDAARELTRRLDPAEVVDRSLDRAMKLSRAATGSIMLVDAQTGRMRHRRACRWRSWRRLTSPPARASRGGC
jgi:hypothetical protein